MYDGRAWHIYGPHNLRALAIGLLVRCPRAIVIRIVDGLAEEAVVVGLRQPVTAEEISGSQVLLTTRKRDVVDGLNPVRQELLSEESASELLAWHACKGGRLPGGLADSDATRDALRMCGGLPLALDVVGGMLGRVKAIESVWQVWLRWRSLSMLLLKAGKAAAAPFQNSSSV